MKKHLVLASTVLLLSSILIFSLASSAQALPFIFSDSDEGGIGSATMDISVDPVNNILTATLENTSPFDLIGETDGGNSPGIRAFGFNLDPDGLSLPSWTLEAYMTTNSFVTIGSSTGMGLDWVLDTNVNNITLDYLPKAEEKNDGLLYNPDASSDPNNTLPGGVNDIYFTTAIFEMFFDANGDTPILDEWSPFVRMRNVGLDGEGSLKLTDDTPPSAVPEPSTILLLGTGLVSLAGFRRKFKKS